MLTPRRACLVHPLYPYGKAHEAESWRTQIPACLILGRERLTPETGCRTERLACLGMEMLGHVKAAFPLDWENLVGGVGKWVLEAAFPWAEAQHSEVWAMSFGDRGLVLILCPAAS